MSDKTRRVAVDAALGDMFDKLEARGVPEHLRNVVDQLDAAARAEEAAHADQDETVRRSPSRSSSPEP